MRRTVLAACLAGLVGCANGVDVPGVSISEGLGGDVTSADAAESAASFEPTESSATAATSGDSMTSMPGETSAMDSSGVVTTNEPTSASEDVTTDPTDPTDSADPSQTTDSGPPMGFCGDGMLDPGEECDAGGAADECDADCTAVVCGDGTLNDAAGEACDDGGQSAACDADCTFADCGDGTLNGAAGEVCDDGDLEPGDGCDALCSFELLDCRFVNGLNWCRNPGVCGQACTEVCAVEGLVPIADSAAWLAAQDAADECTALINAFGFAAVADVSAYTYACAEIPIGPGGVPSSPMYCSNYMSCPDEHRNNADSLGVACDGPLPFQSICPCE